MPKALDQEHKSACSMSARPVSFATLKTYTTRRDTTPGGKEAAVLTPFTKAEACPICDLRNPVQAALRHGRNRLPNRPGYRVALRTITGSMGRIWRVTRR